MNFALKSFSLLKLSNKTFRSLTANPKMTLNVEPETVQEVTKQSPKLVMTSATVKLHPKYSDMVTTAIATLQERGGSSKLKILRFVVSQFGVGDELRANTHVKLALKSGLETGNFVQVKGNGAAGSFKLSDQGKKAHAKALKPKPIKANPKPKTAVKEKKPSNKTSTGKTAAAKNSTKQKSVKAITKKTKEKKETTKKETATKVKKTTTKKAETKKTTKPTSKKSETETKTVSKKNATKSSTTTKKTAKKSPTKSRVVSKKTPIKAKKPKAATPKKTNQKKAATKTTAKKGTASKSKNDTITAT